MKVSNWRTKLLLRKWLKYPSLKFYRAEEGNYLLYSFLVRTLPEPLEISNITDCRAFSFQLSFNVF